MLQISFAKSCKYHEHENERGYLPNVADAMQNERFYLSPQCRSTLQNAENIANTNTTQTLLFVSLLFWSCWFRQFSLLGFAKLYEFLDFMVLFVFTCSPQPKPQAQRNHKHGLHRNKDHNINNINSCWCVPPATPPPTATTTAMATITRNYTNYNTCSLSYN